MGPLPHALMPLSGRRKLPCSRFFSKLAVGQSPLVKLQFDMARSPLKVAFDGATPSRDLVVESRESNWKWWGPVAMWVVA